MHIQELEGPSIKNYEESQLKQLFLSLAVHVKQSG
jgi:hypothetical protein